MIKVRNVVKIFILTLSILTLHSCTTASLHDITSPCVSIESDNPYHRSPCVRKPANSNWEIV